ncbi:hypothetical protein SS50377_22962 [Spironucleus salmonicida]|uniref:Uncharacterized protein n=1 Tax=Spironucleus salmonicida TaxID=348837 RepID=V6LTL7_9EUKA|nr:hypothetical protein SS50377_22962 [Spironucleus salmonicida]|eukprot:EST47992.1 hypothetical protein SS50377_11910 [Spironucleus salmonicida]
MDNNTYDDPNRYLLAIAQYVSKIHTSLPSVQLLMSNHSLLHQYVQSIKVDWHKIAQDLQINRNKIYHWYYETYLRHVTQDKIEKEDKAEMTQLIVEAIISRRILDPTFQQQLKSEVFGDRKVHRADFSMTYNNIIRTKVVKEMIQKHNLQLPGKRTGQSNFQSRAISPGQSFIADVVPVPAQSYMVSPPQFPNIIIPNIPIQQQNQQFAAFNERYKFEPFKDEEVQYFLNNCPSPQLETRDLSIEPQSFEFMTFQDEANNFPWDQLTYKLEVLKK